MVTIWAGNNNGDKRVIMETQLHVQESSEGDYLLIKVVPGQVIAQIDPGEYMEDYAQLFAAAPQLLEALNHVFATSKNGGTMDDIDWSFLRSVLKKSCRPEGHEVDGMAKALSKYGRVTRRK